MLNDDTDLYSVLGVNRTTSPEEIKKAYRKLARQHHPDVDKSANAEQKFKEINEAYQILSDPQKRAAYDRYGARAFSAGGFGQPAGQGRPFTYTTSGSAAGFEGIDPFDIFEQVFGFRDFGRPRRGRSLHYTLDINFEESVTGLSREIQFNDTKLTIKVPAGVRSGTRLRFSGKGETGPGQTPPGDLFLTVRVAPSKTFIRDGSDLYVLQKISYLQAILGDTLEVPAIDLKTGRTIKIKLKVPAGTQTGTEFRLRGKGMPKVRGRGRGDQFVKVGVTIPKRLSKKEKSLLEELRKLG